MTLVVGVVFGAVLMGLFVPRWRLIHAVVLGIWVCLAVAYFFMKNR